MSWKLRLLSSLPTHQPDYATRNSATSETQDTVTHAQTEQLILVVLNRAKKDLELEELVQRVSKLHGSPMRTRMVRSAIWSLAARDMNVLTPSYLLRKPPKS